MSTITYDNARTATAVRDVVPAAPAVSRKGWFARAFARMVEARQRQAMEEVRRLGVALPREQDRTDR
jgi:hypothetical protein